MGIRQGIITRKTAKNKNKKSKYSYITDKTIAQKTTKNKTDKKYSYTRKILIKGKLRYFYS